MTNKDVITQIELEEAMLSELENGHSGALAGRVYTELRWATEARIELLNSILGDRLRNKLD